MSLTGSGLFAVQAVLLQSSLWGEHPGHPVSQLHLPTQLKVLPGTTMSCPVHNSDILGRAPWLATQTLNSEYSTKQWNLDMKLDLKKILCLFEGSPSRYSLSKKRFYERYTRNYNNCWLISVLTYHLLCCRICTSWYGTCWLPRSVSGQTSFRWVGDIAQSGAHPAEISWY